MTLTVKQALLLFYLLYSYFNHISIFYMTLKSFGFIPYSYIPLHYTLTFDNSNQDDDNSYNKKNMNKSSNGVTCNHS